MWNDKKPWWQKPKGDHKKVVDRQYAKNWCVFVQKLGVYDPNSWGTKVMIHYTACAKLNVPRFLHQTQEEVVVVDNLTKQEANEVAKGLNFLDGQT